MTEGFSRIDPELCTGCGNCIETCPAEAITGERHKPHVLSEERCVACGRCVQICSAYDILYQDRAVSRVQLIKQRNLPENLVEPIFAAHDRSFIADAAAALADPKRFVVAQCGPAIFGSISEDFGLPAGSISPGRIVAAMKKIGFSKVYSFSLGAALAVVEEACELTDRLQSGKVLPLINSSCPAAVKYIEQSYPELIHYLAGSKSPHQIAATLIKLYAAGVLKADPTQIFSVSVGPCTSRKFESSRPEFTMDGIKSVDVALTARELAWLIKASGIDPTTLAEGAFDSEIPTIEQTENIYCAPGDIADAVICAGNGILGSVVEAVRFEESGVEGVKTATAQVGSQTIRAAVVTNLKTAIPYLDAIKAGKSEFTFLELLACPMGCASGGGQPKVLLPQVKTGVYEKRAALSSQANQKNLGTIAQLPAVQRIYKELFAKSCGDKSNRALHTEYIERKLSQ